MEVKISVAEILKDKPQGTKLYANAFGELSIEDICAEDEIGITLLSNVGDKLLFYNDGRFNLQGEPILVPSKEMRDWNKFSWKKGDVLVTENGAAHIIFEKFTDDTYTIFAGKYYYCKNGAKGYTYLRECDTAITEEFTLETEDAAKTYISFIEKRLGGKLNRETLEIEKAQPEFKDGDIVFMKGIKSGYYANCIFILRSEYKDGDERAFYYAFYNTDDKFTIAEYGNTKVHYSLRPATDSERQQLFDALAKKGKRWDSEKKAILDLKPKVELKPFDKVLVRDSKSDNWRANLFGYIGKDGYCHCVYANWAYCIPYEGNELLLGTSKDVEG